MKRWILISAGVALIVVVGALTLLPSSARTELAAFSEKYTELVESYQRGEDGSLGENRWDLVERLIAMVDAVREAEQDVPVEDRADLDMISWGMDGTAEARQRALAAILEYEQRGLPELLDEIAGSERFLRPAQDAFAINWLLPELTPMRVATRVSAARMHLALEAGDSGEAARAFEHMLALGRAATDTPFLINSLVGAAIAVRALDQLSTAIIEGALEPADLRLFRDGLERQLPLRPFVMALEGEALAQRDIVRMVYDHPERSPAQVVLELWAGQGERSRAAAWLEVRGRWGGLATREQAIESMREVNARMVAAARRAPHEMVEAMQEVGGDVTTLSPRQSLAPLTMPSLERAAHQYLAQEAMVDGVRLMLALEEYRAARGGYPEALNELEPEYVESLPRDPFTGEMFIYRLLAPGEDVHGRPYLLYSTGLNRTDDGGRMEEQQGRRMRSGATLDHVINRVREGRE